MEHELAKLCIWREARGEPLEGTIAVCWVIVNRMKKQHKTSFEIVSAPLQFSSMSYKVDPELSMYPNVDSTTFITASQTFDSVLKYSETIENQMNPIEVPLGFDSVFVDNTKGATYYRNIASSDSVWFDNAVRKGTLVETAKIGKHTFYKEI